MIRIVALATMLAGGLSLQTKGAEHVLDVLAYRLTAVRGATSPTPVPEGHGGTSGNVKPRTRNVNVRLLTTDRETYALGETVIYEVTIENVGPGSVIMPWSPDGAIFEGIRNRREAILSVEVRDRTGTNLLGRLQPLTLYGAPSVQGSLLRLPPGDRARIRVPAFWSAAEYERDAILRQPGGAVQLSVLYLADSESDRSQNAIKVNVLPR